ncbi:MAG: DUF5076 domain-containing protein [Pirellulaceae bacterium]
MTNINELPIPPAAASATRAVEIARAWIVDHKQHVTLNAPAWKDPAAWGMFLVDLAKHVANSYQQSEGRDPAEVLTRIKAGFDAEWAHATDTPTTPAISDTDAIETTNKVDRIL